MSARRSIAVRLAIVAASFVAVVAIGALVVVSGTLNAPLDELREKYRLPNSQFLDVDGVSLHYVDEGVGPTVVLLHASFMNLRTWDSLAATLTPTHRVIRADLLPWGLTGPDPTRDYSIERNMALLDALRRQLAVENFALLGTSSGAVTAFRYSAQYPEQVNRLILVNAAGIPRSPASPINPGRPPAGPIDGWVQGYYRSRGYWQENLDRQFSGGHAPPEDLVTMVYDMNRRAGLREEAALVGRAFRPGDVERVLGRITAPTFVLWGEGNVTVPHLEADVFEHWLTAAPSLKKKYPRVGHYLYLEPAAQREFEDDIARILAGDLDNELRRTLRVSSSAPPQTDVE